MLVSIAIVALSALGAKSNYGNALKIASSMLTGGLKGDSGAVALGGAAGDAGAPITDAMIKNGTIPVSEGRPLVPKAVQIAP